MLQRSRLWLLGNVVLGFLVVSLAINGWIMSSTLPIQERTIQESPTCELQRATLIQSMQILNDNLHRQEKSCTCRNSSVPAVPPASYTRPSAVDTGAMKVLGKPRTTKGFLTIGIPTVKRDQDSHYLGTTLNSLIEHTTEAERQQVTIVVFLADFDNRYNDKLSLEISQTYPQYLNSGFMQVVQAPKSFYPTLDGLKRNFKDTEDRVKWRSKQCVDYAFLYSYCRDLSQYYLQLEDDVVSSENYLTVIKDFINAQTAGWTMLEFSELGFIGKLFQSTDLQRLADFLMLFYDEMPNDFLIRHFVQLLPHRGTFVHRPSLFQHIGKHSSLRGKTQNLIDPYFMDFLKRKYNDSDNPPAVVSTNMSVFEQFKPQLAYERNKPGYFWAETPLAEQAFFVLFEKPVRLSRIVIETGSEEHPKDVIETATLEASPRLVSVNKADNTTVCSDYVKLGDSENGRFEIATTSSKGLGSLEVKCLKVTLQKTQKMWIVVREIAVWTVK